MNEIENKLKDIKNEMVSKCIGLVCGIPHEDAIDISELEITYNESLVTSVDVSIDNVVLVEFGDGFLIPLKELHTDDIFCILNELQSLFEKKRFSIPFTIISPDGIKLKGDVEVCAPTKVLAAKKAKEYFASQFKDGCWNINHFGAKEIVAS